MALEIFPIRISVGTGAAEYMVGPIECGSTPSGWTNDAQNGTIDWNDSTNIYSGVSLNLTWDGTGVLGPSTYSGNFTASSPCYGFCVFRVSALNDNQGFFYFRNGSTILAEIRTYGTNLDGYHGSGGPNDQGTFTLSINTSYYLWTEYRAVVTSNDGILRAYISANSTKPGTPDVEVTTGIATGSVNNIMLGGIWSVITQRFDHIIVDDSDIGSSP